ncbi:iron ABC transporter permease [Brevundimonas sp. SORGH_AS_0993]|uniref:FecCD family ABC transporter permease n=1 Tax=Brevundimonas sp. SORGH_AS_0993 TaxID=3041794 RepID=UPI002781F7C1|nr:iron ABC transporter permease [Brevundimonas sp. SORGH_AS_0993]MDQ1152810.1 ABC-type Fe3+-siderophore transport system permease subunit [Brevundimonas sp. SORGH_AS_0993]
MITSQAGRGAVGSPWAHRSGGPGVGLILCLVLGLLLLALVAAASLLLGARPIGAASAWNAVVAFDPTNSDHLLIRYLRLPRTLVAIVTGAALGAAGVVMQALTRNPLAEPGLLGVNAGAAAGVVVAIAGFGGLGVAGSIFGGLVGATLAGLAVILLGGLMGRFNPVRLVLTGSALSVILLALTQIITVNSEAEVFDRFRHWAVGSLEGRGYEVLTPVTVLVGLGLAIAAALARDLDAVVLGDDLARGLGASPAVVWAMSSLAVILLAGGATAAAGPISFLGLAAPHVARAVVGPRHRWLIVYAMLTGAGLMLAADCAGRLIVRSGEIDVGVMVALIGAPFFIALVRKGRLSGHA